MSLYDTLNGIPSNCYILQSGKRSSQIHKTFNAFFWSFFVCRLDSTAVRDGSLIMEMVELCLCEGILDSLNGFDGGFLAT